MLNNHKEFNILLINNIRKFRDAWEEETGRNQDLRDERIAGETDKNLRVLCYLSLWASSSPPRHQIRCLTEAKR
jgi:hypothetical protein